MNIKRFTFDKLKRKLKTKLSPHKSISKEEREEIIKKFNELFYWEGCGYLKWNGIETIKYPTDLIIYKEIIDETKPEIIIETGTYKGGSALYFAHLFDGLERDFSVYRENSRIITIDINKRGNFPKHWRIDYLTGKSDNKQILEDVKNACAGKRVMVILDSDHDYKTVLNELKNYSKLVSKGCYLVVEDTNIRDVDKSFGKNAMDAVEDFLKMNKDFEIDKSRERFLITACPNGFLRRVK